MAVQTGRRVEDVSPAEAWAWYLEGLGDEEYEANEVPPPPEDPDDPWLIGDPWWDEQERQSAERRRNRRLAKVKGRDG